jgi:archaellum component FlaC
MSADRYDLVEGLHFVNSQVTTTINVISNLREAKAQMEAMGYSDELFDELMVQGGLKNIVEIDMPKFLDNPVNRQAACTEGFVQTIMAWIVKAIKFIVDLASSIIKAIEKIAEYFSGDTIDSVKTISSDLGKMVNDAAVKAWFEEHGLKVHGYYDTTKYSPMVDNVIALMETLLPIVQQPFDSSLIVTNRNVNTVNVDTYAVRKEFIARLIDSMKHRGRKCDNIDNGFVLRADPAGSNFIELYGVKAGKDFKKEEFTVDVIEDLKKIVDDPLTTFSTAVDHLSKQLGETKTALKGLIAQYKQLEADIDNDTNLSEDEYNSKMNECQIHIVTTQIVESILCQITRFVIKVKGISKYNSTLIRNTMKTIKP